MSVRTILVLLLVSSLVLGQSNALLAQTKAATNVVVLPVLPASNSTTVPAVVPDRSAALPAALPSSPKASSSSSNAGLLIGLALSGTGAALLAKKEPVHQTVCITYDSCPVPGIVRMSGGLMLGVGVPLTVLKLLKH